MDISICIGRSDGHGASRWIHLTSDETLLAAQIHAVVGRADWRVEDTDGPALAPLAGSLRHLIRAAGDPIQTLAHVAAMLERFGRPWALLADNISDLSLTAERFESAYIGELTPEEYAAELVDEGCFGDVPHTLRCYVDYAAIARDLIFGGDVTAIDGHLFNGSY